MNIVKIHNSISDAARNVNIHKKIYGQLLIILKKLPEDLSGNI
jgi:hypothetical protein